MIIVSACLLGVDCKYNGGNNDCPAVKEYLLGKNYFPVCPEVAGGLPAPRNPSEIFDGKVIDPEGNDLSIPFYEGAEKAWEEALRHSELYGEEITLAILKARSPSCGSGHIYDGTFSGRRVEGNGIFARLLIEKNIKIISEEDFS